MWTIRKVDAAHWTATDAAGDVKARLTLPFSGTDTCHIRFPQAPALDYDLSGGMEAGVGYVRGVERASDVHAAETRQPARKASSRR